MEATGIIGILSGIFCFFFMGYIGILLGLYRDNGKENGHDYCTLGYMLGLYRDNGIMEAAILGYIVLDWA